ncbi:hypothetical protein [Bacillus sp. YIM B13441]
MALVVISRFSSAKDVGTKEVVTRAKDVANRIPLATGLKKNPPLGM